MYYQQQQQQGNGLMYPTDKPIHQFMNITVANPPNIPQNIQGDPQVLYNLNYISSGLAMEIQAHASDNSLRCYMFNQCAANFFQNEAFTQLIMATVDYVTLLYTRHGVPNVMAAIDMAIPEMVSLATAVNTRVFPALMQVVPPQIQRDVQMDINKFDQISNELMQMRNFRQQPQQGNFYQNPQQQVQQQGYSQVDQRFATRSGHIQQTQNIGNSVFTTGGGASAFNSPNPATGAGKFSKPGGFINENMQPRQDPEMNQPQQTQQAQYVEVPPQPIETVYENQDWRPSREYPYYPAHASSQHQLIRQLQADGSDKPILRQRNPEHMQYDLHKVPTSFGKPPQALDLSQSARQLQRIQHGVEEINKAAKGPVPPEEGKEAVPVKPYLSPLRQLETSVEAAWLVTNLERLQLADLPSVYRSFATVVEPIITPKNESESVKMMSQMGTYVMACEYINSTYDSHNQELMAAFNRRLTNEVNRSILQELGIPKLSIDSFREDLNDLLDALENDYDPAIKAAFLSRQKFHIIAAARPVSEEDAKAISESFMAGRQFPNGQEPTITYLSTTYSLTHLQCTQWELDIEISVQGLGSAVTEQLTPVLHSLIAGIFDDVGRQAPIDRFLIKTSDGRVLEASKGALGSNIMLVSLVK
jgi:hypothetical protein